MIPWLSHGGLRVSRGSNRRPGSSMIRARMPREGARPLPPAVRLVRGAIQRHREGAADLSDPIRAYT